MAKKIKSIIPKSSKEYKELMELRKKLKEGIVMLEEAKKIAEEDAEKKEEEIIIIKG